MPIFVDSLPIELLDWIFKDLSTDEAALKSCSLTHRSWVAPSRKYIFAELFVGRDKRFEDHKLDADMCQRLFDVLETSPHIASYFTRVTVWVHPDSDSSTKKAKLLSKILPQLTHVRSLVLQSGINLRLHYAHLQSYLRQAITELISNSSFESLTLHEWIFADDASNYVELIDHCSETLKYLSVSNLYFNACLDQSDDPIDLPLELPNLQEYRIRSAPIFVHKQLFTFPKLAKISWPMHKKGGDEDEECASDHTLAGMSRKPSHWSFHILCDDMSEGLPLCPTLPKDRLSAITHLGLSLDTGYSTTFTIKALEHLNDILPTNSGSQIESMIVTFYLGCQPYWMWEEDQWEEVIDALVPILNGNTPDDNDVETQRSVAFVFKIGTWTTPEEPTPEIAEMIEEFGDDDDPLYTDTQKYGNGSYRVQKGLDRAQEILRDNVRAVDFLSPVPAKSQVPLALQLFWRRCLGTSLSPIIVRTVARTDHVDSARSNALVPIPHACPLTVILLDDMEKARGPFGGLTYRSPPRPFFTFGVLSLLGFTFLIAQFSTLWPTSRTINLPHNAAEISARCQSLKMKAGPAADFEDREESDRFVPGTKPYLITDARIWTGLENGTQVIRGDIIVDKGVIKGVGHFGRAFRAQFTELEVIDAQGKWVTPGIVDMHSHLGDASSPELEGAADDNSLKGTAQPWLRSLDGLNTHDDSYPLSISGGITTALVLPGSANAIGGQAYLIKLRETAERTPSSMLLEAPYQINSSFPDPSLPLHWRHMKHACGENPSRVYEDTRMDTIWAFRKAYNHAREIKQKQDAYCERVEANSWAGLGEFPEDLQWEALVDVLRGRVKVNIHCYETVDLDALVRISNEFQFPIAAFHHAHEAYLVPDTLKKAYGAPPTIALFATNARYKKEAYRGSEFAPRILTSHGLKVAMKSDHPVLNSRFLLYEAQQAYFYGMPENTALAAVITTSAEAIGMGHRLGYIRQGWDADLVLWDSHPLALGATPVQVFIDGIPQLDNPFNVQKPASFQHSPKVPNFDDEAEAAIQYEGLQPLAPKSKASDLVVFTNVKSVFVPRGESIIPSFSAQSNTTLGVVVVKNGQIQCADHLACVATADSLKSEAKFVDLKGGSVSPGLVSYGSPLGLENMNQEPSTNDGVVNDPLRKAIPKILGGDTAIARAVDGLEFGSRDALLAYRAGVTTAVSSPVSYGFLSGLGTAFSVSAAHKLDKGAIVQEVTGLHIAVRHGNGPSISTQIAALRRLLLSPVDGALGHYFREIKKGTMPLVIEAHSADVIATLILLKREVERESGEDIKMTISGANEAHILAKELGEADVGVILRPSRPFPTVWEDRRLLPGPPLTKQTAFSRLLAFNVTVGVGVEEIWSARNTRFDLAWAAIETGMTLSEEQALAIGSTNLQKLLGVPVDTTDADMVASQGGSLLSMDSKVLGVISPRRGLVDLF